MVQFGLQVEHFLKGSHSLVNHRLAPVVFHNLRKIAYLHVRRHCNRAGCRCLKSTYQLEYSRLAGTILSDQANLVLFANVKIYVVKKREAPVCNRQ